MQKNEDKFWANLLVGTNPGWTVSMSESWSEGRPTQPHLTSNIYAYDTNTGWSGTCAIAPDNLLQAADIMGGSACMRDAALCFAHVELLRASEGKATESEEATRRAMVLSMYYIAQSQSLKVVRSRYGSVRGHWLSLLYRFQKGQTMIRPVFRSDVIGKQPISKVLLKQWAEEVLHEDQSTEDSGLSRQLRAGNNLVFSPQTALPK